MKKILVLMLIVLSILTGCSETKEKLISGWTIDEITIAEKSFENKLDINFVNFESDGKCVLPRLNMKSTSYGNWDVEEKGDKLYLIVTSKNNPFAGKYQLTFFVDPKSNITRMNLASPDIKILCSRMFEK